MFSITNGNKKFDNIDIIKAQREADKKDKEAEKKARAYISSITPEEEPYKMPGNSEEAREMMKDIAKGYENITPLVYPSTRQDKMDQELLDSLIDINITSEPLNSLHRMMVNSTNDINHIVNSDVLTSLNYTAVSVYSSQLVEYVINTTFINFCNMIDQISLTNKEFATTIAMVPLKSNLYERLNDISFGSTKSNIRSIIDKFMSNTSSPGYMVTFDTSRETTDGVDDCKMFMRYTAMFISQTLYTAVCNSVQDAVDVIYLNVYNSVNYTARLKNAVNVLNVRCPEYLEPLYVSNMIKQYLLLNINKLFDYLLNNVYDPVLNNTFGSCYFNFSLARQIKDNKPFYNPYTKGITNTENVMDDFINDDHIIF